MVLPTSANAQEVWDLENNTQTAGFAALVINNQWTLASSTVFGSGDALVAPDSSGVRNVIFDSGDDVPGSAFITYKYQYTGGTFSGIQHFATIYSLTGGNSVDNDFNAVIFTGTSNGSRICYFGLNSCSTTPFGSHDEDTVYDVSVEMVLVSSAGDNHTYDININVNGVSTTTQQVLAVPSGGKFGIGFKSQNTNGATIDHEVNYILLDDVAPPDECSFGATRICDFNPQDGVTVTGPGVDFDLELFVNDEDIGTIKGVTVTMRNIDQNVLLLGVFSPSDIVLLDEYQLEAGTFNYSTTSIPLADGNYRLRVCLDTNYFGLGFGVIGGWISGAVGNVNLCESHQFIVGASTFIGNISQNLWTDTQSFFGNSTATSSEALAATCNPFLSVFGIRECMAFLFVPDNNQLQLTLTEARNAFLTRIPWGYFTRTVDIMSSPASSTLPAFSVAIQTGAGSDMSPATTSISFDINDMVAGAGSLVDSIGAVGSGVSFRDVFYPIIQGTIAMLVLLTIIADLSNTHNHASGASREKTNTS